jgi:hypothetical protein
MMANRTTDHIIKSLKSCTSQKCSCEECSYRQEKMCREMLKRDALHRLIQLETVRKTIKTNRKRGEWKMDKTHESKYKSVYICSICGHYQVVKKETEQIHYMNYCPFCGSECEVSQ